LSLYEGMFLLDNRQANRDWDGSLASVKSIVTKHGGTVLRCNKWGERRLAYEIKGRRRGTYLLIYFDADGDAVNQIYREGELSDLVLRSLMLKIGALPSEEKPAEKSKEEPAVTSAAVVAKEGDAGSEVEKNAASEPATVKPDESEPEPEPEPDADAAMKDSAAEVEGKEDAVPDA